MFGLARGLNPSSDRREWWPCDIELGRVPGLVIYRFDGRLFFADAKTFHRLTRTIDPRHFYPTIESAVQAYRRETGAEWCKAL